MKLALLFLAACTKTLNVTATIIAACDQPEAMTQASSFTMRVDGDAIDTPREVSIDVEAGRMRLGEIPITENGRVTVLGDEGVFAGALGSLTLTGADDADTHIRIALARTGTFTGTTGPDGACSLMQRARHGHTATLLPDGTVMIAGGERFSGTERLLLRSIEIYDPNTGEFTAQPDMPEVRAYHTATLVGTQLLLCGGQSSLGGRPVALGSCSVFDTVTQEYSALQMTTSRQHHTATVLPDGRVVIIGGVGTGGDFLTSTEIYANGSFTAGASLQHPRMQHTATPIGNDVVIVGGRTADNVVSAVEVWSPASVRAGGESLGRYAHAAARTADGRVVIAGGFMRVDDETAVTDSVEVYDAGISCGDTLKLRSARAQLFAESLGNSILVGGGSNAAGGAVRDAELVTLGAQRSCQAVRIAATATPLKHARARAASVRLSGGDVLIVGGSQQLGATVVPADAGELFVVPR